MDSFSVQPKRRLKRPGWTSGWRRSSTEGFLGGGVRAICLSSIGGCSEVLRAQDVGNQSRRSAHRRHSITLRLAFSNKLPLDHPLHIRSLLGVVCAGLWVGSSIVSTGGGSVDRRGFAQAGGRVRGGCGDSGRGAGSNSLCYCFTQCSPAVSILVSEMTEAGTAKRQ